MSLLPYRLRENLWRHFCCLFENWFSRIDCVWFVSKSPPFLVFWQPPWCSKCSFCILHCDEEKEILPSDHHHPHPTGCQMKIQAISTGEAQVIYLHITELPYVAGMPWKHWKPMTSDLAQTSPSHISATTPQTHHSDWPGKAMQGCLCLPSGATAILSHYLWPLTHKKNKFFGISLTACARNQIILLCITEVGENGNDLIG